MIEEGRSFIAEQPGNLRDRNARRLGVFECEASPEAIDVIVIACVLLTQLLRKRSLSQPRRLGDPLPDGFAVRQRFLHFVR